MDKERLNYLYKRYLDKSLTEKESQEWKAALSDPSLNDAFHQLVADDWDHPDVKALKMDRDKAIQVYQYIVSQPQPSKSVKLRWPRIAAAAAILLATVVTVLYFYKDGSILNRQSVSQVDIHPGGNRATLTLSDGNAIELSEDKQGIIMDAEAFTYDDGTRLESLIGDHDLQGEISISTPKGGQYQVRLSDGTTVWLNAASSLRYPVSFAGLKERRVELAGEAYFQVARDASKPFKVTSGGQEVQVLGTSFNINAYENEPTVSTTLVEGRVRIIPATDHASPVTLKPGQQAVLTENGIGTKNVDAETAVAWKNEKIMFDNERIETIMRMVERWYNVEVEYVGDVPDDKFWGSVSRFDSVSKVLGMLELTENVHFKIDGRKIYVSK